MRVDLHRVGVAVPLEDLGGEAGVQQEHVAGLDDDVVGRHDLLERRPVDAAPLVAEVVGQVDEHAAALHAVERHVLEAEVVREAAVAAAVARRVGLRADEVDAGAVAVVVDGLLDPSPSASNSAPTWASESHWVEYCSERVTTSSAHTST